MKKLTHLSWKQLTENLILDIQDQDVIQNSQLKFAHCT